MKTKILLSGFTIFLLLGCATTNDVNISKNVDTIKTDKMLMRKYHITTNNLIKFGKYYIFFTPGPDGTNIVFLDKKYNEVRRFRTSYFLETKKIAIYNGKIYVLGVNESTYYPEILVLNQKGKLIDKKVIKQKYALPKDLYFYKDNIYVLIDVFKNGKSFIQIYKNDKLYKTIKFKHSINGDFIFMDGNDLFIIGTIKNITQDAFIMNITKGWVRFFNLGMDENFDKYFINKKGDIVLELHSTDEMGADSYYEIIINKDGKILKNKCKIRFNPLPLRFRT